MGRPIVSDKPEACVCVDNMFANFLFQSFFGTVLFQALEFAIKGMHDCKGRVCEPLYGAADPQMTCMPVYIPNPDCSIFAHLQGSDERPGRLWSKTATKSDASVMDNGGTTQ